MTAPASRSTTWSSSVHASEDHVTSVRRGHAPSQSESILPVRGKELHCRHDAADGIGAEYIDADQLATQNSAHTDQDFEKCRLLGKQNCYDGFIYFSSCYKFVLEKKSWIDAEWHCRSLAPGGHLASIHSEEQSHFIRKNSSPSKGFWIGLNDIYKEGTYLWTDGSSSDFMMWRLNQPDNFRGEENCVQAVGKLLYWNDMFCKVKLHSLCSYKLPGLCSTK
ncbi:C-type lectin LmsL-like [Hemiscyllium ocellatum]|uniref:C-type lectin LmsL-like n=1 Tax=Hemiscyllium ocellatum TaxID=170820 RepID=UPI0029668A57|nr:C-type lectin LmsL-like [Hemiscyllium ocellatum]